MQQIPGGVIMPDSSRIKALEKRMATLEAVVEKFTSTNSAMDAIAMDAIAMDAIAWLERCFKYVPDCTWRDDLRRFIESQRHQ